MGIRQAVSAAAVMLGVAVVAAPSAAVAEGHPHGPVVEELASFAAPGMHRGLRLGQHARTRRRPLRDRRQGGPRAPRRSAQRRDHDVRLRAPAVDPGRASAARSTSPSSADTAYVLVTLAGPASAARSWPGSTASAATAPARRSPTSARGPSTHPPDTDFFVPIGVQYALEPYLGGFAVTDGHHNRVLRVGRDGSVDELVAFGNIVPTGLAALGPALFIGRAGPVPAPSRRTAGSWCARPGRRPRTRSPPARR